MAYLPVPRIYLGGIKPCLSAFGGDQFSKDEKEKTQKFFSYYYATMNAGSLLAFTLIPYLKGKSLLCVQDIERRYDFELNKTVYTATPVPRGWAWSVMIWAGALTSMKYSYLNFSTLKQLKNAKKAKFDRTSNI